MSQWSQLCSDARQTLKVLPPPPEEVELLSSYTKAVMSHNKFICSLLDNITDDPKGILIRGQPKGTIVDQGRELEYNHGCVFIPAPNFNKVSLIKVVSNVSKATAVDEICKAINEQLQTLNSLVNDSSTVKIVLCAAKRQVKTQLSTMMNDFRISIPLNSIEVTHADDLLKFLLKISTDCSGTISSSCLNEVNICKLHSNKFTLKITSEPFRMLSKQ